LRDFDDRRKGRDGEHLAAVLPADS